MKKAKEFVFGVLLICLAAAVPAWAGAANTEPEINGAAEAVSGQDPAAVSSTNDLLSEFQGTYTGLFPAFRDDKYDAVWEEKLAQYAGVDAENAEAVKDVFLSVYESDIHGEEAEKKAEEDPSYFAFDCAFSDGVDTMVFEGNTISGLDADGNEVFSHQYEYYDALKKNFDPMTEMYMAGVSEEDWPLLYIYAGDGPDDEFKYFAFADDTPAETYHLEFRYGSDPEDLCRYFTGPYGYWMVSATYKDCSDEMMENCIDLFVEENADSIMAIAESLSDNPAPDGEADDNTTEAESESQETVIKTVDDLLAFASSVNDGSMYGYAGQTILLDADLDLEGVSWEPIGNLSDAENYSTVFMGTFDGQGHTISNMRYENEGNLIGAGLFGISLGTIQNLKMDHSVVAVEGLDAGDSQAFGIIVGYNMGGTVTGCSVSSSSVSGLNCVGAVAGGSGGIITDCTVTDCTVTIIGDNEFTDGIKQCDEAECGGLVAGGAFGGTVSGCTASGKIIAEGNEPVGLGGIAGCLEMMSEVKDNKADVEITTTKGGHAIGGLCGYAGTHSDAEKMMQETGVEVTEYPALIHDCEVEAVLNVNGATHVGGLIGSNLYFFGEETIWNASNCTVKAEINGAVTPGALFGRAENCESSDCTYEVTSDGETLENETGETAVMYESLDQ